MQASNDPKQVSSHGVVIDANLHDNLHWTNHKSLIRGVIFVSLYLVCGFTILQLQALDYPVAWVVCIAIYLVAAASLHGISLFTHEAVHGVLSPNHAVNRALGIACALPVLQNYSV